MSGDLRRDQILSAAEQAIVVDRDATHGDAENNFGLIAIYWSAHLGCSLSASDVAIMMVLFKMARAKGNRAHADNFVDAAGYAAIAGEIGE